MPAIRSSPSSFTVTHAQPWIVLFSTVAVVPALLLIGYQFEAFCDRR
ncbi:hypothetical protein [Halomontanus rarus]